MWRKIRGITGLTLIGLGVIGVFVPLFPSVPLFIAGVALAGPDHPLVRRLKERLKQWRHRKERSR